MLFIMSVTYLKNSVLRITRSCNVCDARDNFSTAKVSAFYFLIDYHILVGFIKLD